MSLLSFSAVRSPPAEIANDESPHTPEHQNPCKVIGVTPTGTPKVCKTMAFWAISRALGLLLLGSR